MDAIGDAVMVEVIGIIGLVIAGFISWLGLKIKNVISAFCDTKTKIDVAKTVVKAIEQMYVTLDGSYKLEIATNNVHTILQSKGIEISEVECRMLIESAVKEVNESWSSIKSEIFDDTTSEFDGMFETPDDWDATENDYDGNKDDNASDTNTESED